MRKKISEADDALSAWDKSIDEDNTTWLKGIVEKYGWPTISDIGPDGSQAAWLLVQHADHDPDFQSQCLALMHALPKGEVKPANIAYLEDRVRVAQGKPQLYGTQFYREGGKFAPQPIEDPDNLEKRRQAMGLEPFSENQERVKNYYSPKSQPL